MKYDTTSPGILRGNIASASGERELKPRTILPVLFAHRPKLPNDKSMNERDQTGVGLGGPGCGVAPCIALAQTCKSDTSNRSREDISAITHYRDNVTETSFSSSTTISVSSG